ncbi:MAG: RNA polymerase sigma factor [Luteimonas sp.]
MAYRNDATTAADRTFTAVWSSMLPKLRCRALRLSNGHHDRADDILADTALKALIFMRRSPESITDPRVFLFVVLRHVFLDATRRQRSENGAVDRKLDTQSKIDAATDTGPSAQHHAEMQNALALVNAAVAAMPGEQQRLFAFRFVDDLPYPVIAERLGINQPLARKRVELLRRQLRAACDTRIA